MSNKIYSVLFAITTVFAVFFGLIGLLMEVYIIGPQKGCTYYPSHYWGGQLFILSIFLLLVFLAIGFLRKSNGKKALIFFLIGFLCVGAGYGARQYVSHNAEKMIANKVGFRIMREKTYNVHGMEYTLPANWKKDLIQTSETEEYRYHFPHADFNIEKGSYLFYGFDVEFPDTDYIGDYRELLRGWFSTAQNYTIKSTEYLHNERFNYTAQKQECTAVIDGQKNYYLIYVVEDRTDDRIFMVVYQKPSEFSVWNKADFDVVISKLN